MHHPSIQKLSVIAACVNEEENLRRFPTEVIETLRSQVPYLEIILVDDGSSDGSLQVMNQLAQQFSEVHVLRHERNRGLGAGLRTGIIKATGDAILTLDADLTFHPREFSVLKDAYSSDVSCVMGSPILGQMKGIHPVRSLLSRTVNKIYEVLLAKRVTSVSSIFRLYRAAPLKELDLRCDSFDINAEIIFKMLAAHLTVVEVPVGLGRRAHGVSKINVGREIKNHLKMFAKILSWKIKNQK